MRLLVVITLLAACSRPAPRAPSVAPSSGVVIMSMHDVEPYEHESPPTPKPPPAIQLGAPLYGAIAGAATGLVLGTAYTLLTERHFPNTKLDQDRQDKALLYGAAIGLAGGTLTLANSISERAKWYRARAREK